MLFPAVNTAGALPAVQKMAVGVPTDIVGLTIGGLKFWLIETTDVLSQAFNVLVATTVKFA